jgi:predicted acylesterase/phospholipase RssA
MATNLTTSRSVVHRRGNSALAIRASVSIPGVLPPLPVDGDLLVDGGVLNILPIDVMREMNPYGTVVASDVGNPRGPEVQTDYGRSLSGWSLMLDKLLPWRKSRQVPSLASTLLTSMVVGAGRARQEMLRAGLADLYLNITVPDTGMLQFDRVDPTVERGYQKSLDLLREWSQTVSPSRRWAALP